MNGIFLGFASLWQGFRLFYGRPQWWKYALLPLLILGVVYSGICWAAGETIFPWLLSLLPTPEGHGAFANWLIRALHGIVSVSSWLLLAALLLLLFASLYEMVSCVFFDALVEKCRMEFWGIAPRKVRMRYLLKFGSQTALFGLNSGLLSLVLLPFALIPVAGPLFFLLVMGKRYALSGMFAAAALDGLSLREVKLLGRTDPAALFAFGIPALLLLTIPILSVLGLPAAAVGGTLLYQQLKAKEPLPNSAQPPANHG